LYGDYHVTHPIQHMIAIQHVKWFPVYLQQIDYVLITSIPLAAFRFSCRQMCTDIQRRWDQRTSLLRKEKSVIVPNETHGGFVEIKGYTHRT